MNIAHLVFVICTASLHDGFVDTTATGDESNHGTVGRRDDLLSTGGQLHSGPLCVGVVSDDGGIVARGAGDAAAIAGLLLQVGDDGTFRHHAYSTSKAKVVNAVKPRHRESYQNPRNTF